MRRRRKSRQQCELKICRCRICKEPNTVNTMSNKRGIILIETAIFEFKKNIKGVEKIAHRPVCGPRLTAANYVRRSVSTGSRQIGSRLTGSRRIGRVQTDSVRTDKVYTDVIQTVWVQQLFGSLSCQPDQLLTESAPVTLCRRCARDDAEEERRRRRGRGRRRRGRRQTRKERTGQDRTATGRQTDRRGGEDM